MGYRGLSFDIQQGWDLTKECTQLEVDRMLDRAAPELLVVCIPCKHWGGWHRLNRVYLSPIERARLVHTAHKQARFAVAQCHKQLKRGGKLLFEHPWSSDVWQFPPVAALVRKYGRTRVDMCAYGLKCPKEEGYMRKATGLLLSHQAMQAACRTCSGAHQHQVIQGQCQATRESRSQVAGRYTPAFVRAFLKTTSACSATEVLISVADPDESVSLQGFECLAGEREPAEGSDAVAEPSEQPNPETPLASDSPLDPVGRALRKLHNNLGHPAQSTFLRVLKNSGASDEALKRARDFVCPICQAHQRPADALPSRPAGAEGFNDRIGMDIKYLQGWQLHQKVPCLNIVDYGSSFQRVVPLTKDTGASIRQAYVEHWLSWAGVPAELVLDPSQPNLSQDLCQPCENEGSRVRHTAADAHWQLGKVERHGGLFQTVFRKVLTEVAPTDAESWKECVVQATWAKNSMINIAGVSPCQFVFGRNPRVPTDLLQDSPNPIASDAVLTEPAVESQQRIRLAARLALVEAQDSTALRQALRARPRLRRDFESGQWVAYWRTQKFEKGKVVKGCRWYGPALVLGKVGRNVIVAHRRSVIRCAPEQLRPATEEERPSRIQADADAQELLGMQRLLDQGKFPQNQLIDITSQAFPPTPEETNAPVVGELALDLPSLGSEDESQHSNAGQTAAQVLQQQQVSMPEDSVVSQTPGTEPAEGSSFGPVRRVRQKSHPMQTILSRPPALQHDDVSEMLHELAPRLAQFDSGASSSSGQHVPQESATQDLPSPREPAFKRQASSSPEALKDLVRQVSTGEVHEALFCQETVCTVMQEAPHLPAVEVLLAGFLQKRLQKELPVSGNAPELQEEIDEAKGTEWCTMLSKGVKVHTGEAATRIRQKYPNRFVGSRFVVTKKVDEDGERIKARWCLQGHLDPDVLQKVSSGTCHSPTMSQLSRSLLLQMIVSNKWQLCLGDIKGAFLEAGPLKQQFRPLFASQPVGGIPGMHKDDVIEVVGNVYGLNDAPFSWYETFDREARACGFERSQFDNCVYFFRDPEDHSLSGVLGAHVDDSITGGAGKAYDAAVMKLKSRFPYRKWRVGSGEFCGVMYVQDPVSFEISYQQREYAHHLRPIALSKSRAADKEAPASPKEISALRGLNGAANWLASQSRPDLAAQVSMCQQSFPQPRVKDLLFANQMVHRARQFQNVEVHIRQVDLGNLCICMHSDAAWGNAKDDRTQAGFTLAFSERHLLHDRPAVWSPFYWKSFRLHRVVPSTLGGEAQAFSSASAVAEWMTLLVSEAMHGPFDLRDSETHMRRTPIVGITDCKSLYDHVTSMSSVAGVQDKRVSVDLAIIKQSIDRAGLLIRWCPTELMVCDALTKDKADPADLLRAILEIGSYQLSNEAEVLKAKKNQRDRLRNRGDRTGSAVHTR